MNKVSFLLLIIITLFSAECRHSQNRTPIFVNEAFQDSLEKFSNIVGDYPDSKPPTIMEVYFMVENKDTIVHFFFIQTAPFLEGGLFKGGEKINGRLCLVKYFGIDSLPSVINESSLSYKRKRYNSFFCYSGIEDGNYSYKTYKLHGTDSLQILDRGIGETESEYNPYGTNRIIFR